MMSAGEVKLKKPFFFLSFFAYIFSKPILLGNFHTPRAQIGWAKARQHRVFVSPFEFETAAAPYEELQEVHGGGS